MCVCVCVYVRETKGKKETVNAVRQGMYVSVYQLYSIHKHAMRLSLVCVSVCESALL